jgi:flagellar motility protein MotE (MotC chaperone)
VESLARTLKGMRPEQAAGVVGRLEKPLAVEILRRMRPADAAALLDRMKPDAAADYLALLAVGAKR